MMEKDPDNRPSIFDLFQTEFIHERVTKWCLKDEKIKAYVEGMVNTNKPQKKKTQLKNASMEVIDIKDNPNTYCETPNLLISTIMSSLTITVQNGGYFSEKEKVFTGSDF